MQTGTRWQATGNPGDYTRKRQQQLLRAKADREAAANIDIAEVRRIGYDAGWTDGVDYVLDRFRRAGLDVEAVLAIADEADAADAADAE